MRTLYLLAKDLLDCLDELFNKNDLFVLRLISLAIAYILSLVVISVGWYIYELMTLGHLNQNNEDTVTALKWAFVVMIPIVDILNMKRNNIK